MKRKILYNESRGIMFKKNRNRSEIFFKKLEEMNKDYNPEKNMLKFSHSKNYNYHTALRGGYVHKTRESLHYALLLLSSGRKRYRKRAFKIIDSVISLQDKDYTSETYGIWPYFYEENLNQMLNPDWNWADFCGKKLLQVIIEYEDKISDDLFKKMKQSILHAANSIIKRDVKPGYTNIAIMGIYVTILAGELFSEKEKFNYGYKKLKRFYNYTKFHGAFTEYNSPTYTIVALKELAIMLEHIDDKKCLNLIKELYNITWKSIAIHFHPSTGLWSGPHSRCYRTLDKKHWPLIQSATNGKIKLLSEKEVNEATALNLIKYKCPERFIDYFREIDCERYFREKYYKGKKDERTKIATSYMVSEFTLGSFFQSDLWNQRRAVIAYWGNYNHQSYLHVRFLHDNYDYSSAVIHSVQNKGKILSIINFVTDGGDKHINLDKIEDGTIIAKDLRLRLELGGNIKDISINNKWVSEQKISFNFDKLNLMINTPYCSFGDNDILYEVSKEGEKIFIDIVLYNGKDKKIKFKLLQEAVIMVAISLQKEKDERNISKIEVHKDQKQLTGIWNNQQQQLKISSVLKPQESENTYKKTRATINGTSIENINVK